MKRIICIAILCSWTTLIIAQKVYLEKGKLELNGITLLQAVEDANAYYYVPKTYQIATDETGKPLVQFLQYLDDIRKSKDGAIFMVSIDLNLSSVEVEALKKSLNNNDKTAKLIGMMPLDNAKIEFLTPDIEKNLIRKDVIDGKYHLVYELDKLNVVQLQQTIEDDNIFDVVISNMATYKKISIDISEKELIEKLNNDDTTLSTLTDDYLASWITTEILPNYSLFDSFQQREILGLFRNNVVAKNYKFELDIPSRLDTKLTNSNKKKLNTQVDLTLESIIYDSNKYTKSIHVVFDLDFISLFYKYIDRVESEVVVKYDNKISRIDKKLWQIDSLKNKGTVLVFNVPRYENNFSYRIKTFFKNKIIEGEGWQYGDWMGITLTSNYEQKTIEIEYDKEELLDEGIQFIAFKLFDKSNLTLKDDFSNIDDMLQISSTVLDVQNEQAYHEINILRSKRDKNNLIYQATAYHTDGSSTDLRGFLDEKYGGYIYLEFEFK